MSTKWVSLHASSFQVPLRERLMLTKTHSLNSRPLVFTKVGIPTWTLEKPIGVALLGVDVSCALVLPLLGRRNDFAWSIGFLGILELTPRPRHFSGIHIDVSTCRNGERRWFGVVNRSDSRLDIHLHFEQTVSLIYYIPRSS